VNYGGEMDLYAIGFKEGAEELFEAIRRQHGNDLLVYPLVYCLRHSVELSLKRVIRASRRLLDEEPGDFPDGHDLSNLWTTCQPLLRSIWPGSSDQLAYEHIKATIEGLRLIDPGGDGFRYPVSTKDKGRTGTLNPDVTNLDLERMFHDVIETLNLLEGADTGIDAHMDALAESRQLDREIRAEYEEDMRAEYEADMQG